jgi:predicted transcriptional regulator
MAMNKVTRTIEISSDLDAAVERLAADSARTPSEIVAEAVEQLLADNDDLSVEMARWAEYERTGDALDEADVEARLEELKRGNSRPPKA